ncbi:TPA: methyltransferase domain-containing protein [Candidatus Nomurabacteria bacterium]|nr:MAG: hypothetical protein O210_OD1C00001G0304 [Parcubacteria bacterium RAAC4_OD1_1]HCY26455.1 methyltransferase domain-containing protein [Candidatus Nomurabacteria bacterium]
MFGNPEQNVAKLVLHEGMRVADFGAGMGAYTIASSKRVGNSGKVYAIEVQKGLVKKLEDELKRLKISNVSSIWGDIEIKGGTKIIDKSIDAIIIANVLFQAKDKVGLIDEAKRILKNNGKILLIDKSTPTFGSHHHLFLKENEVKELFEKRGFRYVENIALNPQNYGIIFTV